MTVSTRRLTLELLAWIASCPRTYDETMETWRSSCPRHPVWDDALADGLVRVGHATGARDAIVLLSPSGESMLALAGQGELVT